MRAHDLDELHATYTPEEILTAVRRYFGLPENVSDLETFTHANRKYYDGGCPERASVDYQQFRQTRRVPLYVGSWLLTEPESA